MVLWPSLHFVQYFVNNQYLNLKLNDYVRQRLLFNRFKVMKYLLLYLERHL